MYDAQKQDGEAEDAKPVEGQVQAADEKVEGSDEGKAEVKAAE